MTNEWNEENLCDTCDNHYIVHRCRCNGILHRPKIRKCKNRRSTKEEYSVQSTLTK